MRVLGARDNGWLPVDLQELARAIVELRRRADLRGVPHAPEHTAQPAAR